MTRVYSGRSCQLNERANSVVACTLFLKELEANGSMNFGNVMPVSAANSVKRRLMNPSRFPERDS